MKTLKTISMVKTLYNRGKLRLTEEGPELLDQQVLIVPRDLFTELIQLYHDNPVLEQTIYQVMRQSVHDFCVSINEENDHEPAEMLHILLHLTRLNGYGNIEINDYNAAERTAVFYVRKLPSENVGDDYTFKADTYWAGMLAGGMSYVFGEQVDALETQCVLEGHNSCRFLVGPRELLSGRYPDLYENKFPGDRKRCNGEGEV